jgi:hypothetical protein
MIKKTTKGTATPRLIPNVFVGDIVVKWSKLLVALGRGMAGSIVVDESADMMRSKKKK